MTNKVMKKDTPFCSFLVHDAIPALSASDWITWLYLVLVVTICNRNPKQDHDLFS